MSDDLTPEQENALRLLMRAAPFREWYVVLRPGGSAEYYNTRARAIRQTKQIAGSRLMFIQKEQP